jgi:hypothetical protein
MALRHEIDTKKFLADRFDPRPEDNDCYHRDNGGGCELMSFRKCKDNYDNCPLEADNE